MNLVCFNTIVSPLIAQARQLVARAIEDDTESVPDLLAIIRYRQRRNHAAYCSNRKRARSRLGKRRSTRR